MCPLAEHLLGCRCRESVPTSLAACRTRLFINCDFRPYNVLMTCNWGDLAIEPSFQPAGPLTGPYLFRFIALTGASRPLSGRGEDEHSLQVPRHGDQSPLAAHFLQPAQ